MLGLSDTVGCSPLSITYATEIAALVRNSNLRGSMRQVRTIKLVAGVELPFVAPAVYWRRQTPCTVGTRRRKASQTTQKCAHAEHQNQPTSESASLRCSAQEAIDVSAGVSKEIKIRSFVSAGCACPGPLTSDLRSTHIRCTHVTRLVTPEPNAGGHGHSTLKDAEL
jgi:hypothetical protein